MLDATQGQEHGRGGAAVGRELGYGDLRRALQLAGVQLGGQDFQVQCGPAAGAQALQRSFRAPLPPFLYPPCQLLADRLDPERTGRVSLEVPPPPPPHPLPRAPGAAAALWICPFAAPAAPKLLFPTCAGTSRGVVPKAEPGAAGGPAAALGRGAAGALGR